MALAQFLGNLGSVIGGQSGMGGDALETPFAMSSMEPQQQKQPGGGLLGFFGRPGTRDALGQIGDYLLQANDMAPIYGPRKAQRDQKMMGDKLAQYLGAGDAALMDIIRTDPQTGMALLKMKADQAKGQTPDVAVIDGVAFDKRTGQPLFESPYDKIIPGPDGSFYRVPRLGLGRTAQATQAPQAATPQASGEDAAAPIIAQATRSKVISPEDYAAIQQSLGPNGRKAADQWREQNGIQIGRQINGKTYVQRGGDWYEVQ